MANVLLMAFRLCLHNDSFFIQYIILIDIVECILTLFYDNLRLNKISNFFMWFSRNLNWMLSFDETFPFKLVQTKNASEK